ncbi:MAG: hypothetical protein H6622_16435 [Halobacteriovoraceae bacterium]|nr:hypothetical protein [Halobacteriovoraceae bacterium]
MSIPKLRVTYTRDEILKTLNKIFLEKSPVLVWQNNGNQRDKKYTFITAISTKDNKFELTSLDTDYQFEFDRNLTFYIRGNEQSILFKDEKVELNVNKLKISIPSEVRMFEKRGASRTNLSDPDLPYIYSQLLQGKKEKNARSFTFQIIDISQTGLAVRVSLKQQHLFYPNDFLLVKTLGNYTFEDSILCKIIYLKKQYFPDDLDGQPSLRMGINFESQISLKILDQVFEKSGISI